MLILDGIVFSLQKHGGISVYFHELICYLNNNDVSAIILTEKPLACNDFVSGNSVSILSRQARLLERYRSCRIPQSTTVFHSSYYRLPYLKDIPTVVTVYDFVYERYLNGPRRWLHSAQKNLSIRSAQSVICISEATRQDLLEYIGEIPGQSVHVIHCGVSEIFRPIILEQTIVPFILYVGQRGGYKNFRLVLESMRYLPDIHLICVGGGNFDTNEFYGIDNSVVRRVKHVGFVVDDALNILYNQALCLVYPSSYEGFGIPVVEAMRAGCPVVCIDCKAVLEIGHDALTVVDDLDPRGMAIAITKTVNSDRISIIKRGFAVAQNYSWDAAHKKTLEIYRSMGA